MSMVARIILRLQQGNNELSNIVYFTVISQGEVFAGGGGDYVTWFLSIDIGNDFSDITPPIAPMFWPAFSFSRGHP